MNVYMFIFRNESALILYKGKQITVDKMKEIIHEELDKNGIVQLVVITEGIMSSEHNFIKLSDNIIHIYSLSTLSPDFVFTTPMKMNDLNDYIDLIIENHLSNPTQTFINTLIQSFDNVISSRYKKIKVIIHDDTDGGLTRELSQGITLMEDVNGEPVVMFIDHYYGNVKSSLFKSILPLNTNKKYPQEMKEKLINRIDEISDQIPLTTEQINSIKQMIYNVKYVTDFEEIFEYTHKLLSNYF